MEATGSRVWVVKKCSPVKIWTTLKLKGEWMLHCRTFLKVAVTKWRHSLRVSVQLQTFTIILNTGGNCLLSANGDGIYTVSGDKGSVLLFPD